MTRTLAPSERAGAPTTTDLVAGGNREFRIRRVVDFHPVAVFESEHDLDLLDEVLIAEAIEVPTAALRNQGRSLHDQGIQVGIGDDVDADKSAGSESGFTFDGDRDLDRAGRRVDGGRDAFDEGVRHVSVESAASRTS